LAPVFVQSDWLPVGIGQLEIGQKLAYGRPGYKILREPRPTGMSKWTRCIESQFISFYDHGGFPF
jgi:hypothetical protein